jgi:hypothetical protein
MLLGFDSAIPCRFLAEVQEFTDTVPELGELSKAELRNFAFRGVHAMVVLAGNHEKTSSASMQDVQIEADSPESNSRAN